VGSALVIRIVHSSFVICDRRAEYYPLPILKMAWGYWASSDIIAPRGT